MVLYAWSICCVIDSANLKNWEECISRQLSKLLEKSYLQTAYVDTKASYIADILGGLDDSAVQEDEAEEDQDAAPDDQEV